MSQHWEETIASLWGQKDSYVRDFLTRSCQLDSEGRSIRRASNALDLTEGSATGQNAPSYHIKMADRFPTQMQMMLYFPRHPKQHLLRVTKRSKYDKTQTTIAEYLQESAGSVDKDCVKIVVWVEGRLYHVTSVDKFVALRSVEKARFDNSNKFNDVICDAPTFVVTDGQCRITMIVMFVPQDAQIKGHHVRNNLCVLLPESWNKVYWPNAVRMVANADPRKRVRRKPKTVTSREADAVSTLHVTVEESMMVSHADDFFGSSEESACDDDNNNNNTGSKTSGIGQSGDESDSARLFSFNEALTDVEDYDYGRPRSGPRISALKFDEDSVGTGDGREVAYDELHDLDAE